MTTGSTLLLATVALAVICVAVSAASKRPGTHWNCYHFDGSSLVKGTTPAGGSCLAVQEGVVPAVMTGSAGIEAKQLPPGSGALAGVCYIRTAGGKLASNRAFSPYPGIQLSISAGEKVMLRTRTDESGYFIAVLPAGLYRINNGAFAIEARVAPGQTKLVALQAGKRMVD